MVSDDGPRGMSAGRTPNHTELLDRATEAMIRALDELRAAAGEMATLLCARRTATAAIDEERRYAALRRVELRAHRRYLAAQRWHDNVRRHLLQVDFSKIPADHR
jgi:hypothetical protein